MAAATCTALSSLLTLPLQPVGEGLGAAASCQRAHCLHQRPQTCLEQRNALITPPPPPQHGKPTCTCACSPQVQVFTRPAKATALTHRGSSGFPVNIVALKSNYKKGIRNFFCSVSSSALPSTRFSASAVKRARSASRAGQPRQAPDPGHEQNSVTLM